MFRAMTSIVVTGASGHVGGLVAHELAQLEVPTQGATEAMLAGAGVPFTAVRNAMYADGMAGWFDDDDVAREPAGDARMSFSWRPELARVVARTLTEDGHEGRVYDIVTPE